MMFYIYPFAGILTGLLATLFGFGGGFVVVPLLFWLLPLEGVPRELAMHMAIGTSLMIMLFNMIYATFLHAREKNIKTSLLYTMLPFLVIGAIIGSLVASLLDATLLKYIFILFILYVLIRTIKHEFSKNKPVVAAPPNKPTLAIVSILTGIVASLLGIGGSVIIVPFFRRHHMPMANASALANALAIPSGFIGSIVFIIAGMHQLHLPKYSTGYIYWPAFIGIMIGSFIGAKVGIYFTKIIPDKLYGKIYVCLLALVIVVMMIK